MTEKAWYRRGVSRASLLRAFRSRARLAVYGATFTALIVPAAAAHAQLSYRRGLHVGVNNDFTVSSFEDISERPSFVISYAIGPLADFQLDMGPAFRFRWASSRAYLGGAIEPGFLFHFGPTYTAALRLPLAMYGDLKDGKPLLTFSGDISPAGFDLAKHGAFHMELFGSIGFAKSFAASGGLQDKVYGAYGGGLRLGGLFL
jgi:hypothetical protein